MQYRISPILRAALVLIAVLGCDESPTDPRAPIIDDIRPAAAAVGEQIALVGRRFGLGGPRDGVWVGGKKITVESWSDGVVLLQVPPRVHGVTYIVMRSGPWVSAPRSFEVLPAFRGTDDLGDASVGDIAP